MKKGWLNSPALLHGSFLKEIGASPFLRKSMVAKGIFRTKSILVIRNTNFHLQRSRAWKRGQESLKIDARIRRFVIDDPEAFFSRPAMMTPAAWKYLLVFFLLAESLIFLGGHDDLQGDLREVYMTPKKAWSSQEKGIFLSLRWPKSNSSISGAEHEKKGFWRRRKLWKVIAWLARKSSSLRL